MFSTFELSKFLGRKVALYRFTRHTTVWRFNSSNSVVNIGGFAWAASGISHNDINDGGSTEKNQLTLKVPYLLNPDAPEFPPTQALGNNWHPYPPTQRVLVDVWTTHLGDPDQEINEEWTGRVIAPRFDGTVLSLVCDPSYRNPRAPGSTPRWQRGCYLALYSQGVGKCGVLKAAHALPATLTAVTGLQVTAAAFGTAPKNLAGGFLEWTNAAGFPEARSILAHTGSAIVVDFGAGDLLPGLVVTAYPGCSHDTAGCASFDNSIRYPGFKDLPTEDPMPRSQAW